MPCGSETAERMNQVIELLDGLYGVSMDESFSFLRCLGLVVDGV